MAEETDHGDTEGTEAARLAGGSPAFAGSDGEGIAIPKTAYKEAASTSGKLISQLSLLDLHPIVFEHTLRIIRLLQRNH